MCPCVCATTMWMHTMSSHIEYKAVEVPQYKAVIEGLTGWVCNMPDLTIKQTYYCVSLPDGYLLMV